MNGDHLAVFIRSLAGGGGAERMMVNLATAFAAAGHRVDLVLGRAEGSFLADVPPNVRIVDLGGHTAYRSLPRLLRDPPTALRLLPLFLGMRPPWVLGCAPALARYLYTEKPKAMLSALNYSNVTALWAKRIAGVSTRVMVSERNTLSVRARRGDNLSTRALPRVVRYFYPWADVLAAVSNGVADDLAQVLKVSRSRVHTIYNPVVTPEIETLAEERVDHPWFAPGQPPVVLGAGKLKRQKDFTTLIRAFAILRRELPARLVILGDGPERKSLERYARDLGVHEDVDLLGFVRNPFAFMANAAVFVLSSAWEGLPAVLIQAMACGCPVVSTGCRSGPAEILDFGAYGPLVPVGDPEALARAIASTLASPPDAERLRERAAFFSSETVATGTLELLLGHPGR